MNAQKSSITGNMNREQKRKLTKTQQLQGLEILSRRIDDLQQKYQKADQDVDTLLQMLVRSKATHAHHLEKGDTVVIGILGRLLGEDGKPQEMPFQGGVADTLLINSLGHGELIPGMEDQIIGKKVGDQFDAEVQFPADYAGSKELAGKKATFFVVVHAAFSKTNTSGVIVAKQNDMIKVLLERAKVAQEEAQAKKAAEEAKNAENASPADSNAQA